MTSDAVRTGPEPLVSVVVPCYQAAATIGDQLSALAAQVEPGPFEVLVADNGSHDGTQEIVADLAGRWPRLAIRLVDASAVRGAGPARNAGARVAGGEVLAFCDADDVVDAGWVRAVRSGVAAHGFVAGRLDGELLNEAWTRKARQLDQQDGTQEGVFAPWLPHAGAGNLAMDRELFEAVGGFDPACRYLEDTDLCWRVQLVTGVPLVFWRDAVVHSRLRIRLSGTFAQGWHYGAAAARLRERYALVDAPPPATAPGAGRPRGVRGLWRSLVPPGRWDRGALAHVLWHGGWRLGWRTGGRAPQPGGHLPQLPRDLRRVPPATG